jgi:DNA-binding transcriptional regulator/RsmH inhibitor MraZ
MIVLEALETMVNDRLEIWATDKFNSLIEDNLSAISDVAENLFEGLDIDA